MIFPIDISSSIILIKFQLACGNLYEAKVAKMKIPCSRGE